MNLDSAIKNRDTAESAYRGALVARSVSHSDKSVTRQDVTALRVEYEYWERVVANLQRQSIGAGNPSVAIARWTR